MSEEAQQRAAWGDGDGSDEEPTRLPAGADLVTGKAHYHDNDATPIAGGWACYCDRPESPDRPPDWSEIRSSLLRRPRRDGRRGQGQDG